MAWVCGTSNYSETSIIAVKVDEIFAAVWICKA